LLVVLILVSSSFLILVYVGQTPTVSKVGVDDSSICRNVGSGQGSGGVANEQDWAALADESGFVDVVVILKDKNVGQDPVLSVVHKVSEQAKGKDGKALLEDSKLLDEIGSGAKKRFLHSLSGFSAHLTVESIYTLSSLDPSIEIFPDVEVHALVSYNVRQVGADQMWTRTDPKGQPVKGDGVVVAVIDTGIDYTHPDLGGGFGPSYKVIGGYDFYNNDSDPIDDNGHGTHVAGIIAGDGTTFKGVAPDARLLAYKVLGSDGYGKTSDIIEAVDRALDPNNDGDTSDHADVISLSLGGTGSEVDPMSLAVDAAVDMGVVVVVAAGNDGPSLGTVASPGCAREVITVGAIDAYGNLASFSSRGTGSSLRIKPEICAPGVYINSTVPFSNAKYSSPTGYRMLSGTSMATPHVSGAAALLLQLHPDWTPGQVKSALLTGANSSGSSVWYSGAGDLWIPSSADADLFVSEPLVSYTLAGSAAVSLSVRNSGAGAAFSLSSIDWYSLLPNGTAAGSAWSNLSYLQPSSSYISSDGTSTVQFVVGIPASDAAQGYYEGEIRLIAGSLDVRVAFGYALLSRLNVHVLDIAGKEVFDQDGWVAAYSIPDADVSMTVHGGVRPSPPAGLLLPAGTFSVHAAGHQMIYRFDDPYLLSAEVTLGRLESKDLYLSMSSARQFKLDLQTNESVPIYAKDFRLYCKYSGENNFSVDLKASDYSVDAADLLYLPKSKVIYVSDTNATVGISIVGYSYSASMWDFMVRNWDHWYQFTQSTGTNFYIESTADLQYFLAWEFNSISSSTPLTLTIIPGEVSTYETKYDIPGTLRSVTGNWGSTVSSGGLATFYVRRDTDTPINPFFSGMTRTTIVQGVFTEVYLPGDLYDESFERELYAPDYNHVLDVMPSKGIYLPERDFLTSISGVSETERIGAGPVYPAVRTSNTNTSMVLYQPLLRDQGDAKVVEAVFPTMTIYRDGLFVSSEDVLEFMARPDAFRIVSLPAAGFYTVDFKASATPQICNNAEIVLGFRVPGIDINPPQITGLKMSQRFAPGQSVGVELTVKDDISVNNVEVSWRSDEGAPWQNLVVSSFGAGRYGAVIQTSATDIAIHLRTKITDSSGNYVEFFASNASLKQVPVLFDLSTDVHDIEYKNADVVVSISGHLTNVDGTPLSADCSVPLDLMLGGRKVAMILDDSVSPGSRTHNGTIRFAWHLNPVSLFSGPNETANIQVDFDLGTYQPVTATITLHSIEPTNRPPTITLLSPSNGSLIPAGQVISLDIKDDGSFSASAYLDGSFLAYINSPWQIPTASWTDGIHVLQVVATDDQQSVSRALYQFEIDASAPSVTITSPKDGSRIPAGSTLTADVRDAHLSGATYSVDGGPQQPFNAPYILDMTGWTPGQHTVTITATDAVGHSASKRVTFAIAAGTMVLQLLSPADGAAVRSGTSIEFVASGNGTITYRWCELGLWHDLGAQSSISTVGWSQGLHTLLINATSDLGGWDEIQYSITIDDITPVIQLLSPSDNSYVSPSDSVRIRVQDANLKTVSWTLFGVMGSTSSSDVVISLAAYSVDGPFFISVLAVDKAGNSATAQFAFVLDSAPPVVSVGNLVSGSAINPGFVLNFSASDAHLTSVQCSLDNGAPETLTAPFRIDTSQFSLGWHSINLTAYDASGKSTSCKLTFYLDGAVPSVSVTSGVTYDRGVDFEVWANVTDDYGVASVTLFYELRDGTFASKAMTISGSEYIAAIPSAALRDGMTVYIVASDSVGNSVESPRVILNATAGGPTNNPDNNRAAGWSFFGLPGSMLLIICAIVVSSGAIVYTARNRGWNEKSLAKVSLPAKSQGKAATIAPAALSLSPRRTGSQVPGAKAGLMRKVNQQPVRTQFVPAAASLGKKEHKPKPTLMEAIPEVVLKCPASKQEQDSEIDYGALIERELITPLLKNSVFRDSFKDFNAEIELKFEELRAMCREKPEKRLG